MDQVAIDVPRRYDVRSSQSHAAVLRGEGAPAKARQAVGPAGRRADGVRQQRPGHQVGRRGVAPHEAPVCAGGAA